MRGGVVIGESNVCAKVSLYTVMRRTRLRRAAIGKPPTNVSRSLSARKRKNRCSILRVRARV